MTDDEYKARIERRLTDLERATNDLEVKTALSADRQKRDKERLDKQDSNISKLVWIVVLAVVAAFAQFVLDGGLANVGN